MGKWAGEKMAAMARLGMDVTLGTATKSMRERVVTGNHMLYQHGKPELVTKAAKWRARMETWI